MAVGRFWAVRQKLICDTAHNREGLSLVFKQLQSEKFQRLHVVLGMVNDKDVLSLLELFPKQAQYYFCKPNVPRGLEASQLAQIFTEHGFEGSVHPSVKDALNSRQTKRFPRRFDLCWWQYFCGGGNNLTFYKKSFVN